MNGYPDDLDNRFAAGFTQQEGYFFHRDILNRTDWASTANLQTYAQKDYSPLNGEHAPYDTQPDEFSFDFAGYSGKFYLNADGSWKVKCNRPVTVTSTQALVQYVGYPAFTSIFSQVPFPVPPGNKVYIKDALSKTFAGFTITTEDGIQYTFGNDNSAIDYSISMFQQNTEEWDANAWYLTTITHPDGTQVAFRYMRYPDEYVAQMYFGVKDVLDQHTIKTSGGGGIGVETVECSGGNVPTEIHDGYSGKLISPVYLSMILTSTQVIHFNCAVSTELPYSREVFDSGYSKLSNTINDAASCDDCPSLGYKWALPFLMYPAGNPTPPSFLTIQNYPSCLSNLKWRKLTNLWVESTETLQPVKKFVFIYNNDDPANTTSQYERLMLLQVSEQGTGNVKSPPYYFSYNKYHSLPGYCTDQIDHWGFYNANSLDNATRILAGRSYLNPATYYTHREATADSAVYLAGMLTRIVYPTGGVTDFAYEQHQFGQQLDEYRFTPPQATGGPLTTGGVRIREITSYSLAPPAQKVTKEYLYVNGYSPTATLTSLPSSGILGGRARYLFSDFRAHSYNDPADGIYTVTSSVFSTQSVLPTSSNSQGSHVGYSTVIERRGDGSYTEYKYSNFDSGNLDEAALNILYTDVQSSRTLYSPYSSTSEERGNLLQEMQVSSAGIPVKKQIINYIPFNKNTSFVPIIKVGNGFSCYGVRIDQGLAYKLYTYSCLPAKTIETLYDATGNQDFTTTTTTAYNAYQLPSTVTKTSSTGDILTTYRYPWEYNYPELPLTDSVTDALAGLIERHMLYPIETIVSKDGQVVAATVHTFKQVPNLSTACNTTIQPYQLFQLAPTKPLPLATYAGLQVNTGSQPNGNNNPPLITPPLRLTYTRFDSRGNVRSTVVPGGQPTTYVWDYRRTRLVAQVSNAAPSQVAFTSFEDPIPAPGDYGWEYDWLPHQVTHLQSSGGASGLGCYILDGRQAIRRSQLAPGYYEVALWARGTVGAIQIEVVYLRWTV